jgi:hypothetical protein
MKIRPVGSELFHACGRSGRMTKLIVAFRNFANAPNYTVNHSTLYVVIYYVFVLHVSASSVRYQVYINAKGYW